MACLLFIQVALGLDFEHFQLVDEVTGVFQVLGGLARFADWGMWPRKIKAMLVFCMTRWANMADIICSRPAAAPASVAEVGLFMSIYFFDAG